MIAFLLVCLLPAALMAACVPVVLFGLMLETARERGAAPAATEQEGAVETAPLSTPALQCA